MQHPNSQDHLPASGKQVADTAQRDGVAEQCPAPHVRQTLAGEASLIDPYDRLVGEGELSMPRTAQAPAVQLCAR